MGERSGSAQPPQRLRKGTIAQMFRCHPQCLATSSKNTSLCAPHQFSRESDNDDAPSTDLSFGFSVVAVVSEVVIRASLPPSRSHDLNSSNCLCNFLDLRSPDFSPCSARVCPYICVYLPFLSLSCYHTSRKTEVLRVLRFFSS